MTTDEEMALKAFAHTSCSAGVAWVGSESDPPDAISEDGRIGLELTCLAPSESRRAGSPVARRRSLRRRILLQAEERLKSESGRGFRVYVLWRLDPVQELRRTMVAALSDDIATTVLSLVPEARQEADSNVAGSIELFSQDFVQKRL